VVSRFTMLPVKAQGASPEARPDASPDGAPELRWLATASRHWNIDRPDPR
jgi:hypothetical protein